MPLPAVLITVTAAERKALKKRVRGPRLLRAGAGADRAGLRDGRSNARIARDLRISQTRYASAGRFAERGLKTRDLPRLRPRQISAQMRAAVVALACQLPPHRAAAH